MGSSTIKWIFFDVGGTLFDDAPIYRFQEDLIRTLLAEHGITVTDREFQGTVRAARRHYLPRYVNHLIWTFAEEPGLYERIAVEYEKRINKTPYSTFRELVQLLPGMRDLLMDLSMRYALGLIGNQPAMVRQRLEEENIIDLFHVHALSAELNLRKPDLRFFLGALSMAQCHPAEAAMVGDRLDNDVFPARMLGMTTIRLKSGPHKNQPVLSPEYLPHYTANNTRELARLLLSDEFVSRSNGAEMVW